MYWLNITAAPCLPPEVTEQLVRTSLPARTCSESLLFFLLKETRSFVLASAHVTC